VCPYEREELSLLPTESRKHILPDTSLIRFATAEQENVRCGVMIRLGAIKGISYLVLKH
jgi:hypothetical protein